MPKPKNAQDLNEEIYGEAEALRGITVESLRLMSIYAYDHRRSPDDMRAISMAYERSAPRMASAVMRWPAWFFITDNMPPLATSVDDCLCLFSMASLPKEDAAHMFREWRNRSLRYWQLQEHIDRMRGGAAKIIRLRMRRVKVVGMNSLAMQLKIPNEYALLPEMAEQWVGREARLLLEQVPAITPHEEEKEEEPHVPIK